MSCNWRIKLVKYYQLKLRIFCENHNSSDEKLIGRSLWLSCSLSFQGTNLAAGSA